LIEIVVVVYVGLLYCCIEKMSVMWMMRWKFGENSSLFYTFHEDIKNVKFARSQALLPPGVIETY